MPPTGRLTLVQRQQMLIEARGFSKPTGCGSRISFAQRQDDHLVKTGRSNAVGTSRCAVTLATDEGAEAADDGSASVCSRVSHTPSLHPSIAGSVMSEACHPETIGAGDETHYWDFLHRAAERQDLGHKCRECRRPFTSIGEPLTERRGARLSMRYHAACFSGFADPRSTHVGRLAGTQLEAAPANKASKMRTSSHFEGGGEQHAHNAHRAAAGGSGKTGMGLGMGSNGFGDRSSKGMGGAAIANESGVEITLADMPVPVSNAELNPIALQALDMQQKKLEHLAIATVHEHVH